MLDRKTAADLYLNLLVPWEKTYRDFPQKGYFDIRRKDFVSFTRQNNITLKAYDTRSQTHTSINDEKRLGNDPIQIMIFQKGDNSRVRSLFKHLRNAVAHAHVSGIRIRGRWYLMLEALSDEKMVLKGQLQQAKLSGFVAALKSTAKRGSKI